MNKPNCPPCHGDCHQGRTCPAENHPAYETWKKWHESITKDIKSSKFLFSRSSHGKAYRAGYDAGMNEAKKIVKGSMSREAMQMALEALETVFMPHHPAVIALRERLAQPEQEPVAWISESENLLSWDKFYDHMKPLYTEPPKREWVGLTGDEARKFYEKYTDREELIYAIDKFLEEKNNG